jgi:hypothetical protein
MRKVRSGTWTITRKFVPRTEFHKGTEAYKKREAERMRRQRKEFPEIRRALEMSNYRKHRNAALDFFGRECACCGEAEPFMLNIDHINNDGKEHRAKHGTQRAYLKSMITDPGARSKYRTLCRNCNYGRQANGGGLCPHEVARMAAFALCA